MVDFFLYVYSNWLLCAHTLIWISTSTTAAMMVSWAWLVSRGRSSHDWNGILTCASWIRATVPNCCIRNDISRDAACYSRLTCNCIALVPTYLSSRLIAVRKYKQPHCQRQLPTTLTCYLVTSVNHQYLNGILIRMHVCSLSHRQNQDYIT